MLAILFIFQRCSTFPEPRVFPRLKTPQERVDLKKASAAWELFWKNESGTCEIDSMIDHLEETPFLAGCTYFKP